MQLFSNEQEFKNIVSGLRRELKAMGLPSGSHTQMLEALSRSLGHGSFASLTVALSKAPAATAPRSAAASTSSPIAVPVKWAYAGEADFIKELAKYAGYRLLNDQHGDLDLIVGSHQDCIAVHGMTLSAMDGTVEDIMACKISALPLGRLPDGSLELSFGDTTVNWEGGVARTDTRGVTLWVDSSFNEAPEDTLILVPAGCESLNLLSEAALENEGLDLRVRDRLLNACFRWIVDQNLVKEALDELDWDEDWGGFSDVFALNADATGSPFTPKASVLLRTQWVAGFAMHVFEFKLLRERLMQVVQPLLL